MTQTPAFRNLDEQVFCNMNALKTNTSLLDCLIAMQTAEGIDEATAEANAEHCMLAISQWDGLYGQVSMNALDIMNSLLENIAGLEDSQRILALHQILFGLTAYSDPETAAKLDEGIPSGQLFRQHYEAILSGGNAPSAEELENQIRIALTRYRISPAAMRMLTGKMLRGEGYLATAEALGEDGRNLKCLLTMETWLQNRDHMTMEEAANTAASSVQTQAVADAVQRGYIARDVAKKILIAIGIVVAIAGVVYMIHSMPAVAKAVSALHAGPNPDGIPMSPLLKSFIEKNLVAQKASALTPQGIGALLTFGGGAMVALSDKAADLISTLTVRFSHLFRKADSAHAAAMETLAREACEDYAADAASDVIPAAVAAEEEDEDEAADYTFF